MKLDENERLPFTLEKDAPWSIMQLSWIMWTAIIGAIALVGAVTELACCQDNLLDDDIVIHVATTITGTHDSTRLELLINSILLFHEGTVHIHIMTDSRSRKVLPTTLVSRQIKRLRWSLYPLRPVIHQVDYIPIIDQKSNAGLLRMFSQNVLPLYVEKVIIMDADSIVLEDIAVIHGHFKEMERQGAFFAASGDLNKSSDVPEIMQDVDAKVAHATFPGFQIEIFPRGLIMADLKQMRGTNWDDLWRKEALRLIHESRALASEQDILSSLELQHQGLIYRLPRVFSYRLREV